MFLDAVRLSLSLNRDPAAVPPPRGVWPAKLSSMQYAITPAA